MALALFHVDSDPVIRRFIILDGYRRSSHSNLGCSGLFRRNSESLTKTGRDRQSLSRAHRTRL